MAVSYEQSPKSYQWYEVWQKIYFSPTVQSFLDILADPAARANRAFLWVAIVAAISGLVQGIVTTVTSGQALSLVCGVIGGPIFAVIGLAIGAGILHLIAGMFGGRGTFDRLAYALGAISAPASLVGAVLSAITLLTGALPTSIDPNAPPPTLGLVGLCLLPFYLAWFVYMIVLQVNAVRAAEGLSTGSAVLTVFLPTILLIILGVVCIAVGLIPVIMSVMGNQ